jgi:hypothetical protein
VLISAKLKTYNGQLEVNMAAIAPRAKVGKIVEVNGTTYIFGPNSASGFNFLIRKLEEGEDVSGLTINMRKGRILPRIYDLEHDYSFEFEDVALLDLAQALGWTPTDQQTKEKDNSAQLSP